MGAGMKAVSALALLLASASILSGCLGGKEGSSASLGDGPREGATLRGVVTDEEYFPLAGAVVSVRALSFSPLQLSATTDIEGNYLIQAVPAGQKVIVASLAGFVESETRLSLAAGEVMSQDLVLERLPATTPRISPQAPFTGRFDCAAEWGTDGGSCDKALPPAAHPFTSNDTQTFQVPPAWGGLLLEVEWSVDGQNQLITGLRFWVNAPNGTAIYASAESTKSPLRVAMDRGFPHPGSTDNLTLGTEGGPVVLHVQPLGSFDEQTCAVQCEGGLGVALNLNYKVWPTLFFGGRVDPTYTTFQEAP